MMTRTLTASAVFFITLSAQAQPLDGLWLSDGNGLLFDVKGEAVRAFEITSISCLPAWQVTGNADPASGGGIIFNHNAGMRRLLLDATPNKARLWSDCSSADILLRKTEKFP